MANRRDQDNQIRITHYINPHNFWFKQESAYQFNAEEQSFQQELNQFCDEKYGRGNISSGIYTPKKVGETVALYYCQLARWIRAEVDDIQPDLSGQVQCNLWAIDEGVPVKSSCRYIKPLPERFATVSTSVLRGGVEGVLPAECSYDYLQGRPVDKMVEDWSPGLVRVFEGCIEEAVCITFSNLHHYKVTGIDMYYGVMKITSHQSVTNTATDLLKRAASKMVMLVDKREFYDRLPQLRTLDMHRFEDNERVENMKFHSNTMRLEYSTRIKTRHPPRVGSYENQAIEQAREKVLDWDERNKRGTSVGDYSSMVQKSTVSRDTENKRNRPTTSVCVYSQLINESVSSDEEPAQVEIKLPAYQPKQPPPKKIDSPSSYQRPQNRVYNVKMTEVDDALNAIKLRRQAAYRAQNPPLESTSSSNRTGATPPALNIVPAGFSMNNVNFSGGSVILGASEVGAGSATNRREATAKLFNRNGPRKGKGNDSAKSSKIHYEYCEDDQDSSFEEEMVRKLTITAIQEDNDDNEQW